MPHTKNGYFIMIRKMCLTTPEVHWFFALFFANGFVWPLAMGGSLPFYHVYCNTQAKPGS